MTWLVTPDQTLSSARQGGLGETLKLSGIAVLTFCRAVGEHLEAICGLDEVTWIGPQHHPYAEARIVKRGLFEGLEISMLVPPMGSSPLACIVEDLAACGAEAVFLVCGAWSLGPPVQLGDLIIPTVSLGADGTSIHYGTAQGVVRAAPAVVEALAAGCQERGVRYHVGGNGACEALYRITPDMVAGFRACGCLCMDNGEASTLFAVAPTRNVLGGVLFQPYIELARGWDPGWLNEQAYQRAGHLQAEVVLQAGLRLKRQGLLGKQPG